MLNYSVKKILLRLFGVYNIDRIVERKVINSIELFKKGGIYKWLAIRKHYAIRKKYGVNIWPEISVGKNLQIVHYQNIQIGKTTVIGDNCIIYHNVDIVAAVKGDDRRDGRRHAKIGNRCIIGAGARLVGPINIGDDVFVGANALITEDIPSHVVCTGVNNYRIKKENEINKRYL